MVLMALPPPPPTPNTLMMAWQRFSSTIVNILDLLSLPDMRASSFPPFPVSEELRQISPDPPQEAPLLRHVAPRHDVLRRHGAVEHQPHGGGAGGAVDDLHESADADRAPPPHREPEYPFAEIGEAVQHRAASGEHHSRPQAVFVPGPQDLPPHEGEDLLRPRLDDLAQVLAADRPRLSPPHPGQFHQLVPPDFLDHG